MIRFDSCVSQLFPLLVEGLFRKDLSRIHVQLSLREYKYVPRGPGKRIQSIKSKLLLIALYYYASTFYRISLAIYEFFQVLDGLHHLDLR